jgi:hypothetical protein
MCPGDCQGLLAIGRLDHGVPMGQQDAPHRGAHARFVLGQENVGSTGQSVRRSSVLRFWARPDAVRLLATG